jgi:hypothetical protein
MRFEGRHVWIALVVTCLFAAIGGFIHSGGSARPNAKLSGIERQSALDAADDLLVTSASIAYERGLALTALSATEPIGPTESAAITERRVLVDGATTRTQMHLVHLMHLAPSAVREKIMDRIAVAYAKLVSQREEFDREARKPAHLRDVNASLRSFDMPTALISAMQELLGAIHLELKTSDQGMVGWLEVQRLSLEMAEYAGRERAQIAAYLAAGARGAGEQLRGQITTAIKWSTPGACCSQLLLVSTRGGTSSTKRTSWSAVTLPTTILFATCYSLSTNLPGDCR